MNLKLRIFRIAILAGVSLIVLQGAAAGQNLARYTFGKKHRAVFGFKAGIINRASFRLDGNSFETDAGWSLQTYWGIPVDSHLIFAPHIELNDIQALEERQWAIDIGLDLKYHIYNDKKSVSHKPGVGIGYGHLALMGFLERSDYLTIRVFWEMTFFTRKRHAWLLDLTAYGAPVGGNDDYNVTYGPVVLVRLGVVY